jgi:hypothetical protein
MPRSCIEERVHTCVGAALQHLRRCGELVAEHERVEGHIALHTAFVQPSHDARQIVHVEIRGTHARIELL